MQCLARRLILGLLALSLPLHPAVLRAEPLPEDRVYVALGDSLARGVGATDPARLGYVPRLLNYFRGTAHGAVDALVNVAVPGETSSTMLTGAQLSNALEVINDPSTDTRVLTLDIGGNDLVALLTREPCATAPSGQACRQAVAETLQAFAINYASILAQLTAALKLDPGDETVIVMTYFNYLSGTGDALEPIIDAVLLGTDAAVNCAVPQATWGLNDIITCVGITYGIAVADTYAPFSSKGATLTHSAQGDFHPNDAGYAMIASAFRRAARLDGA